MCSRFTGDWRWWLHSCKRERRSKIGQRKGSVLMQVGLYTFLYLCYNQSLDVGHPDGAMPWASGSLSWLEEILKGLTTEACVLTTSPRIGQKAFLGGGAWGRQLCLHLSKSLLNTVKLSACACDSHRHSWSGWDSGTRAPSILWLYLRLALQDPFVNRHVRKEKRGLFWMVLWPDLSGMVLSISSGQNSSLRPHQKSALNGKGAWEM